MKRWLTVASAGAAGAVAGAITIAAAAGAKWDRATAAMLERLTTPPDEIDGLEHAFSRDALSGLPAPVARYFEFALTPGQPLYRRTRLQWEGTFRMAPNAEWKAFVACQHATARPPGFVWDATIRIMPGVPVRVRDAYVGGEGVMLGKIAAVVPVVDQRGTPEMASGALSRYLGEAVWFPTALLPGAGVLWTPVDDTTARATLSDRKTTVSADFSFAGSGQIVATSMTRYRDVNGHGELTPFEAVLGSYRRVSGMMVPVDGEAAWILPEGRFAFWRGRMIDARYEARR